MLIYRDATTLILSVGQHYFMYDLYMSQTFEIPAGSFGERKARADEIARGIGATPGWRNGYYMAVRQDGELRTEFHFAPLILAADAEE